MTRFLVVVPPLTGHTNPTVAVGQELLARGHDVAWCGFESFLSVLLPDGAEIVPLGGDLPGDLVSTVEQRSQGLRGAAAFKFLWEDFLHPLADFMVPGVDAAIDRWKPDVLIVDQQAVAGALVARRHGIPWATSATTSAELVDPFAGLPKLRAWVDDQLSAFQIHHGVPESDVEPDALRFSDDLVIAFTTPALAGSHVTFPDHYAFVGPAITGRPSRDGFPWEWLDGAGPRRRPAVLVSLGTVNAEAGERFYRAAIDGLGEGPYQAILIAPPDLLGGAGALPSNVMVQPRVPQLALLEHLDLVVCHAGHNTVCETLAHGLPLVVAPIRDDQPVVAEQVVAAGAGVRVKFARVRPQELRAAVDAVLLEPSYREAARVIADSFTRAGGAARAADRLELLGERQS